MKSPLSSLKILDFSTLLPGPFATMMLADMGADILWVDSVKSKIDQENSKAATMREYLGRSKRSIALDLKKPEAGYPYKPLPKPRFRSRPPAKCKI